MKKKQEIKEQYLRLIRQQKIRELIAHCCGYKASRRSELD